MSKPKQSDFLTPQEREIQGLPNEPNVPPDCSYSPNPETFQPTEETK